MTAPLHGLIAAPVNPFKFIDVRNHFERTLHAIGFFDYAGHP